MVRTGNSVGEGIYRVIEPDLFEFLGDSYLLMYGLTLTYSGIESLEWRNVAV